MIIRNHDYSFHIRKEVIGLRIYDIINHRLNINFIHFSFKDPWWKPKIRHNFYYNENKPNNTDWLAGWLFFYFGNMHFETDQEHQIEKGE